MGAPSKISDVKKHTDERLAQILDPVEPVGDRSDDPDFVDQEDLFWMIQKVSGSLIRTLLVLGAFIFLLWFIWEPEGNPLKDVVQSGDEETQEEVSVTEIDEEEELVVTDTPEVPAIIPAIEKEVPSVVSVAHQQDLVVASGWHEWIERMIFHQDEAVMGKAIVWLKDSRAFFDVPLPELISGASEAERVQNLDTTLNQTRSLIHRSRVLRAQLSAQVNDFAGKATALNPDRKARQQFFIQGVRGYDQLIAQKSLKEKIELDKRYLEFIAQRDARKLVLANMVPYEKMFPRVEALLVGNRHAIVKNIRVVDFPGDPFHTILTPAQWRSVSGQ